MLVSPLEPIIAHAGRSIRPVGAIFHDDGVTFRVWAPAHNSARVATGDGSDTRYVELTPESDGASGFLSGRDERGRPGDLYWIQLADKLHPDPASRFQPRGVEGPSQVVDPRAFSWQTPDWRRPKLRGRVIYELHIGTFTAEGTFPAATTRLDALVELGVNTIELMPLADFTGGRNWGYDGVMLFAPARCYGTPDELHALIDAAHQRGLAVILDVVYNHLGPCGNVLPAFSPYYFHDERSSIWGAGLNFDGPHSAPVREFFLQNACMWFDEFQVDGLRLDAVHAIHDAIKPNIVAEIAAAVHARGGFVIAEDERNDAQIITPQDEGGWGADGMWSDDFHHTLRVALTGQCEAHFANYTGAIDEWVATLREGWYYRGQPFPTWKRPRGTPAAHLSPEKFVLCISNHDQVGNRPLGDRLTAVVSPEAYRAASMLLCLVPHTPMLFMGQEWAAATPFPFFTDHPGEVGTHMAANRLREFQHYGALYSPEVLARMPDPQAEATFRSAKLDWTEREKPAHGQVLALYQACLQLRASHAIFQSPDREAWAVEPVAKDAIGLRWRDGQTEWFLALTMMSSTLSAPASGCECVLSSNAKEFGGNAGGEFTGPVAVLWRRNR